MSGHAHPSPYANLLPAGALDHPRDDRPTAYTDDRLIEMAAALDAIPFGIDAATRLAATEAAHALRLVAAGDLEVIRCTCELYGVATCPTCGG